MVSEGGKSGSYLCQRADQGWPPPRPADPVEIGALPPKLQGSIRLHGGQIHHRA